MITTPLKVRGARLAGHRRPFTVQAWFNFVLGSMSLLLIIAAAAGTALQTHTTDLTDDLLDNVAPAQVSAYQLQAALVNQESGARGYSIAANPQFLQPYLDGKQEETAAAGRIRSLLAGDRPLIADLNAIERGAVLWRANDAEPLIEAVTPGSPRPPSPALAERDKADFDRLRSLFDAQNANLAGARLRGQNDLARVRAARDWVFVASVAAFLTAALFLTVLLRRSVSRPLRALAGASRRVAGGDFSHRIVAEGPADLRALAEDVEEMRSRIVRALQSSEDRRQTLARQAVDLDAQAVELRRSNAELEQFAYVASHDLQEPLRKVASFCQLLEKRYGDQLDERALQYIGFAVDGAKRMQVLINDLLTFSRVGRVNDAHVPVGLDESLDKALTNLSAAIEDAGAVLVRPPGLPVVCGDPTLLGMLWQNLVGNAVKFRRPGHTAEIAVACDPPAGDAAGGRHWRLSVTDNGIGIAPQFADKVFVIFQRLHTRDAYGGSGIGLALCKKIVEYHGGEIWIDTGHTGGTRVCFTLPEKPAEPTAHETAVPGLTAGAAEGAMP